MTRRELLRNLSLGAAAMTLPEWSLAGDDPTDRPNVLIIFTDDQGFGDLGCHGNPDIETPAIDRFYTQATRMTQFYAQPVCTPARACLMTGRHHFRTRAIDTFMGRAMMDPEEVTLAEAFGAGGYKTGIFGKWHLGDNYPMRAIDQGFGEALVHRGGGIGHFSDGPHNTYSDPILQLNGAPKQYHGYCTDIFTGAAIEFIEKNRNEPFLAYLASNIPHDPLQIPDRYVKPFRDNGLSDENARVYGMLKNLDNNVARLLARLDELKLTEKTIVIFMSDNGPAMELSDHELRYNAGLRGEKKQVYEGGIRVPCFIRWPNRFEAGRDIDRIASLMDIKPTLMHACGLPANPDIKMDGVSLMPLLTGALAATDWSDRAIHFQWHRGNAPEPFRNAATRTQDYKLVDGKELYDVTADPAEADDIAARNPDVVARLRSEYETWFKEVCAERGFGPPRIHLGSDHENPTVINPTDWRNDHSEDSTDNGYWLVHVERATKYNISLQFEKVPEPPATVHFKLNDVHLRTAFQPDADWFHFEAVDLPQGDARIEAWVAAEGGNPFGAQKVKIERLTKDK